MPDTVSPYLQRPLRSLEQFQEGQSRLAEQKRYENAIAVLEALYWRVEENMAQGEQWRMRNELKAAADLIRSARGL